MTLCVAAALGLLLSCGGKRITTGDAEADGQQPCEVDSQCGEGMRCEDGMCVIETGECEPGNVCGSDCCEAGEECLGGMCVPRCEGTRCVGACCDLDEICLGGACCDVDKACNGICCGDEQQCRGGVCSDCPDSLCAGVCCDEGEVCLAGIICCDADKACGDLCCGPGEECSDGACIEICEGVMCGGVCCDPGEVCEDNECKAPCEGERCGELCCPRGEICLSEGLCCASTMVCGELCCPDGQWCGEEDTCIACDRPLCAGLCCGEDMVCFAGSCCTDERICMHECCAEGFLCEGETCHLECGDDIRCENSEGVESCCTGGQVCFMGECILPTNPCTYDGECELDEYCDEIVGACLPIPESECEYHPPIGEFSPEIEWTWSTSAAHRQIMMTPAIGNLTDDNGDTVVDLNDIPDIVVIAFSGSNYHTDGVMYVLSGDDGSVHYTVSSARFRPGGSIAIGDVDGDTVNDIAACGTSGGLYILNNDTSVKWFMATGCPNVYSHPLIADLDADGTVEIVTDYRVFANNAEVCRGWDDNQRIQAAADLDGDTMMEVVGGNRAMKFDPSADPKCWEMWTTAGVNDGYPAVADMDGDTDPDVVTIRSNLWILEGLTGAVNWGPIPIPGGGSGGAPTIADFDGDGKPEVSTAGLDYYTVYDMDCTDTGVPEDCGSGRTDGILWSSLTRDHSSSQTGSSVFDFEGDGAAEVIYADELSLRIYRGTDGAVLYQTPNSSGTLFEYPLVADVDNDQRSEIVVIANDYAFPINRGVRVIGDSLNNWVRTRRIWNQHTYHVTNVNEDGTIPAPEIQNWTVDGLNNYRQNVQTYGVHNAPNMVPEEFFVDDRFCPFTYRIGVRVMNRGSRGIPAGLNVAFYEGDPEGSHRLLDVVTIDRPILSGDGEYVSIAWAVPEEDQVPGMFFYFYVVVDDTTVGEETAVRECREDDNASDVLEASCEIL